MAEAPVHEKSRLTMWEMLPLLTVYDVGRSIEFYRDVLGFEVQSTFEVEGGLGWAALRRDAIKLMLNSALEPGVQDPEEDRPRSTDVTFYIGSDNVVEFREDLIRSGIQVGDLHETYYGMRQFALYDPDGYKLVVQEPARGTSVSGAKPETA